MKTIHKKEKRALAMAAAFCAVLFLSGCTPGIFAPSEPEAGDISAVILERSPSFGDVTEMRTQVLVFSQDGVMTRLELGGGLSFADATDADVASSETRQAQAEAFGRVAKEAAGFAALPDEIETGVLDGDYEFITVQAEAESWRKGGLAASEEGPAPFRELYAAMWDAWQEALPVEDDVTSGTGPAPAGEWALGNTPGNLASGIDALACGGEVYVTLYEGAKGRPVRLAADGSAQPTDLPGAQQALDGWLYYSSYGAGGTSIERVRPEGGEPESLLSGRRVVDWQVAGGYLYVLEDESPPDVESYIPVQGLWRRPIEGGPEQRCAPGNVGSFALSPQYLFASMLDDPGFVQVEIASGEVAWLDVPIDDFFWLDGYFYYYTEEDGWGSLWRVGEDESEPELLVQRADGGFNVEGDWLYYNRRLEEADRDHWFPDSVLERKNLQTGEVQPLDGEERLRRNVALAGDWVVFDTAVLDETHGVPWGQTLWCVPKDGGRDVPSPARQIIG